VFLPITPVEESGEYRLFYPVNMEESEGIRLFSSSRNAMPLLCRTAPADQSSVKAASVKCPTKIDRIQLSLLVVSGEAIVKESKAACMQTPPDEIIKLKRRRRRGRQRRMKKTEIKGATPSVLLD
jgi:hypothetical protein